MDKLKKKMAYGLVVCMIALGGLATLQCSNQTADVGYFVSRNAPGSLQAVDTGVAGAAGAALGAKAGAEIGGTIGGGIGLLIGAGVGAL